MNAIDYAHFLEYCKEQQSGTFSTLKQEKPFTIHVSNDTLRVTPGKGGKGNSYRCDPNKSHRILERLAQTDSYHIPDYKDIRSYNVSYLLPLGQLFLQHLPHCKHLKFRTLRIAGDDTSDIDKAVERIEEGNAWEESDEVVQVQAEKPLDKVIPVRLSSDQWEELRREAKELSIGPTTLARIWILERLRQKTRASV